MDEVIRGSVARHKTEEQAAIPNDAHAETNALQLQLNDLSCSLASGCGHSLLHSWRASRGMRESHPRPRRAMKVDARASLALSSAVAAAIASSSMRASAFAPSSRRARSPTALRLEDHIADM